MNSAEVVSLEEALARAKSALYWDIQRRRYPGMNCLDVIATLNKYLHDYRDDWQMRGDAVSSLIRIGGYEWPKTITWFEASAIAEKYDRGHKPQ